MIGRTRRQRVLLLLALAVLLLAGLWVGLGGMSRVAVHIKAKQAFLDSRPGKPDSYQFISRGVEYGMSPQQVDAVMIEAYQTSRRMPVESPRWEGFVNIYMFQYGPAWRNRLQRREVYLYEEWYWVYFDRDERAVKLERSMLSSGGHPRYERNVSVDLKDRVMTLR